MHYEETRPPASPDVAPSASGHVAAALPSSVMNSASAFDHLINQRELLSLSIDLILQPLALILLPALPKSILLVANNSPTIQYGITAHIRILAISCFIGRIYVETSC